MKLEEPLCPLTDRAGGRSPLRFVPLLSTLFFHGLRREELCSLKVRDITERRGVLHLRVQGKGGKIRYLPLHPGTAELITEYVEASGQGNTPSASLFRPVKNSRGGTLDKAITPDGVYRMVLGYAKGIGLNIATTRLYDRRKTRPG